MYKYHKTYHKSSHVCECENRSLLLKGCRRGQKSVLTELAWANPRQSSETAAIRVLWARHSPEWRFSSALRGRRRNPFRPGREPALFPLCSGGGCSPPPPAPPPV